MPRTHGRGRVFLHRMDYPSTRYPLVCRGTTQETDFPYRSGSSVVVKAPFSRFAVVVGIWGTEHADEDDALLRALGARHLEDFKRWVG